MRASPMSAILLRAFVILVYLVPKKLRAYLLPSWLYPNNYPNIEKEGTISSSCPVRRRMDATDLSRVFQMLDQNGDGRITLKELNDSLQKMGIFISDEELNQMIEKIDANGDGCVDMEEFGMLYQSIMEGREQDEDEDKDMKEAFNVFDQNGDGFITADELKSVLGSLGLSHGADDEFRMMIKRVDIDGDGMVSFMEFKQMMRASQD